MALASLSQRADAIGCHVRESCMRSLHELSLFLSEFGCRFGSGGCGFGVRFWLCSGLVLVRFRNRCVCSVCQDKCRPVTVGRMPGVRDWLSVRYRGAAGCFVCGAVVVFVAAGTVSRLGVVVFQINGCRYQGYGNGRLVCLAGFVS